MLENLSIIGITLCMKELLQEEFIGRCRKNESYSMRAFAKSLGVDQSLLSKVMRGKRKIGLKMALTIGTALNISSEEIHKLVSEQGQVEVKSRRMAEDIFSMISDWYHYAILELIKTKAFKFDYKYIATALSINTMEAQAAVERLERLGFVTMDEKAGTIEEANPNNNWVDNSNTTAARKLLQKQLLSKAITSIDEVPFEKRSNSSLTVAITEDMIPVIQKELSTARMKIHKQVDEQKGEPDRVYQLCFAAFPLTREKKS